MSFNAFFKIAYDGAADTGAGAIAFANGKVAGLDVAGIIYKGTYEVRNGEVVANLVLSTAQSVPLVTGVALPAGGSFPLSVSVPLDKIDGHLIDVQTPTGLVKVRFSKIGDL